MKIARTIACGAATGLLPLLAGAAEIDGAALSRTWALPFAGLLLSIALVPLAAPGFWHRHFGKIAAAWALAFLLPFAAVAGAGAAAGVVLHALLAEYLPFIVLLTALFTVSGGIYLRGNLHGSAGLNTGLLAAGAVLASVMGTTGAAMLLLRPLIRANDNRRHQVHVVVFFIFIVCNAGGALTPLGDPPLFLGFLQGVGFFWPLVHLWPHTLLLVGSLLAIFHLLDRAYYRREGTLLRDPTPDTQRIGIDGARNFALLGAVVALVLMSGLWTRAPAFTVAGVPVSAASLLRDAGLVAVTLVSLAITPRTVHEANRFAWAPMAEVAKLFAGIFVTIAPVIAMLQAGAGGPFGADVAAVTRPDGQPDPALYFWATGLLSGFLDNAPTYLVFFHTAGGDVPALTTTLAPTLAAISAGAVFMGALTYIGNAPNLMVRAIAVDRGIPMPGFFGYMAWSCGVLLPLFLLVTFVFFRP
ncbi:sodium:proton antiporter [uncultured Xylophilus sp.]|uniref:sodium:proton antiporter n=1 Tax=uncultured Xylophilus sp. TaxID=296832 RepID=UPI0025F0841C|nr:sodium:proton antiporter [uncultured Xylophilus sp.]